jgi:hypothetical protein
MDMVNVASLRTLRFFSGSRIQNADSMRGNDAGYALGVRLDRAYSARAAQADRKWSLRRTLIFIFIVAASAFLWAAIIWACLNYL